MHLLNIDLSSFLQITIVSISLIPDKSFLSTKEPTRVIEITPLIDNKFLFNCSTNFFFFQMSSLDFIAANGLKTHNLIFLGFDYSIQMNQKQYFLHLSSLQCFHLHPHQYIKETGF